MASKPATARREYKCRKWEIYLKLRDQQHKTTLCIYRLLLSEPHGKCKTENYKRYTYKREKTTQITIKMVIKPQEKSNQRRKRNKTNPDWKRSKTLFADDMILYTENPNDSTRILLELIN